MGLYLHYSHLIASGILAVTVVVDLVFLLLCERSIRSSSSLIVSILPYRWSSPQPRITAMTPDTDAREEREYANLHTAPPRLTLYATPCALCYVCYSNPTMCIFRMHSVIQAMLEIA
jgi:hypothetical protein